MKVKRFGHFQMIYYHSGKILKRRVVRGKLQREKLLIYLKISIVTLFQSLLIIGMTMLLLILKRVRRKRMLIAL